MLFFYLGSERRRQPVPHRWKGSSKRRQVHFQKINISSAVLTMSEQKILIDFREYQKLKEIERKYHESLGKVLKEFAYLFWNGGNRGLSYT